MIHFRTGIPIILLQLFTFSAYAWQADSSAKAAPADSYSFEKADSLVRKKRYEQAIWAYINLYPRQPDSVTALVRRMKPLLWDDDLPGFVKTTFARFAPMDPDISTFSFSGPTMDTVQLKRKAAWSEALIKRVAVK